MLSFHQFVFIVALLSLSWFVMMAVHELGHVVGALSTGGNVQQVVLHPLTISRTDVAPNPNPSIVVWFGPILGCLIPVSIWMMIPRRLKDARAIAMFFAGFCLIANGGYIAIGSFDKVGDCGVMLQHGSPMWLLFVFGAWTIPLGFYVWHRLGSVKNFLSDPSRVGPGLAYSLLLVLILLLLIEFTVSPT